MSVNDRNGKLVASFPVEDSDQIMLVTDKGQLIRCPVEGIRIAGRSTQGVIVFDTAEDEHVVSVEHIGEDTENGNGNGTRIAKRSRRIASGEWSIATAIRCSPFAHPESMRPSGGIPRASKPEQPGSTKSVGRLWRAVGGHQTGFADHGLGAGDAQAGSLEIRPGLLRAVAADGADIEPVALGEGYRHAGFDLRGKAGKNGEGGGNERCDGDG